MLDTFCRLQLQIVEEGNDTLVTFISVLLFIKKNVFCVSLLLDSIADCLFLISFVSVVTCYHNCLSTAVHCWRVSWGLIRPLLTTDKSRNHLEHQLSYDFEFWTSESEPAHYPLDSLPPYHRKSLCASQQLDQKVNKKYNWFDW